MENEFNWPFTAQELTETVNEIDNQWGLLADLNVSPGDGVSTTAVEVAITGQEVRVLPARKRGGDDPAARPANIDKSVFIEIPHFPQLHTIKPKDLQDWVKKADRKISPVTLEESLELRLETMRLDHDLTLEFIRMGALKGNLTDGEGTTLLNLFTTFGVTKKTVDFELDDPTTNVRAKCSEVVRHVRGNLKGEIMTGVSMICDPAFFDSFTGHAKVEEWYKNWQAAQTMANPQWEQYGRTFRFGGLTLQEYDASVPLYNGSTGTMVAEGYGHAFPLGTRSAYQTYFAPPDHIEHANEPGLEILMTQEMLKHGAGVEIKSQSAPLSVFRRPAALVECVQY